MTDRQVLSALNVPNHEGFPEPKPEIAEFRLRYRTIRVRKHVSIPVPMSDIDQFIDAMRLAPGDGDLLEMMPSHMLFRIFQKFAARNEFRHHRSDGFGRGLKKRNIVRMRRMIAGKRGYFYAIRKENLIQDFLKSWEVGDDERRQNKSCYRAAKILARKSA